MSVSGKKEELALALLKDHIDIGNGCEPHIDQCIHDSVFLLVNDSSFRKDGKDGWCGAIVVVKNNLTAEQITSVSSEIVATKITTHRLPIVIAGPQKILLKK